MVDAGMSQGRRVSMKARFFSISNASFPLSLAALLALINSLMLTAFFVIRMFVKEL
ncbi:hypothetical protein QG37_02385 [Candidozyma auris]|uniref:Uncharacterized protein n=1 Tax=Candidozyma auris TaxID=498019 RepID=A0A0L0P257_CANAR|nr:hypothetical protein QG37_02385 [[Candida] auris]